MLKRRTLGIAIIVLIVVVAIVLVLVLGSKGKTSNSKSVSTNNSGSASSSKTITLDNLVTITFPCLTHAEKLKPTGTDNTTGFGADCGVKVNNGSQELVFTAAVERYPNKSPEEKAVFNYCTAKSTYPGPVSGSTIYIIQPSSENIDNINFSTCELSIDANTAYEATARAIDGDYGILLNADVSSTTNPSSLLSYMHNFMSTMKIKQ